MAEAAAPDTDTRTGSAPPRVIRLLTAVGATLLRWWNRLTAAWQRSIQLRVITATLALSVAVVSLLGITLMRQITDGLLEQKRDAALAYAAAGLDTVQQQLEAAEAGDRGVFRQIVGDQAALGGEGGPAVLLIRDGATPLKSPGTVIADSVPEDLRTRVGEELQLFWTYTEINRADRETGEPAIAVGGRVFTADEQYGLYYLFPLTEQAQTLSVVWTALATAGLLLVLLLGAVAWLVTRQVVTPVRMAAKIAARFSAGRLSERMAVRGRDDIARLASSFNQMAGSLQHKISELEELSRVQQQFVSDVSHELRTPLTTVRMAADVLHESRDQFEPEVQRAAELLQAQLDRFEALLADLLEISRFDAGAAVLNAESGDIRDMVFQVADAVEPLAVRKGSAVRVDAPAEPCVAEFDRRRIERVVRNLVVNAIEHGEGRDVVVRVAAGDGAVAVAVRDYGVGLKPGESSLAFHRFWRADPARARSTGGTGLGLAISLEDARLHGGWLQAWGEPGMGSQFRLTLPARVDEDLTSSPIPLIPEDAGHGAGIAGLGSPNPRLADDEPAEVARG
ncbi:MAG TPA: MtrAB system histidine kinase MtrB [Jiangellales bacterium]|nr:MtrAB system histidine kinase MtrB [Jiangellales bacterium]